jgi:phosphatidate cytidylyltransferase
VLIRILTSLVLAPLIIFIIYLNEIYFNFLIIIIFFIGVFEINAIKNLIIKLIIFIIFIIFLLMVFKINYLSNGIYYLYYILIISSLSDIGGYIIGKYFGIKKISIISPNKTYLGFLGSILLSQLGVFYLMENDMFEIKNFYLKSLFVFICCVFVILGDLFFSYFKRVINIKDYSKLLPGHGGLLDRIDGMIFLTYFIYCYLFLIS